MKAILSILLILTFNNICLVSSLLPAALTYNNDGNKTNGECYLNFTCAKAGQPCDDQYVYFSLSLFLIHLSYISSPIS